MDFSFFPLAQAAPPPDFIYQAGNQAIQLTSVMVVGFSFFLAWCRSLLVRFGALSFFRKTAALLFLVVFSGAGVFLTVGPSLGLPSTLPFLPLSVFEEPVREATGINGSALAAAMKKNPELLLIDVREDEERAAGFIPGSIHMRMADVYGGGWRSLPDDRPLYVHCATGTRSEEVANFLATKGLTVFFLNDSLDEWVESGYPWKGTLAFAKELARPLQRRVRPDVAYELWKGGALIVDARHETDSLFHPFYQLPVLEMSSEDLQSRLSDLPHADQVFFLADSKDLSGFSAFIAGLKLQALGYDVKGIVFRVEDFLKLL